MCPLSIPRLVPAVSAPIKLVLTVFLGICLPLQIIGGSFALLPQFSDRSKKKKRIDFQFIHLFSSCEDGKW